MVALVGCSLPPSSSTPAMDAFEARISPTSPTNTSTPTQTTVSNGDEETEIRELVTNFGTKLQGVSLLAPDAAQEIQHQYAEFVSPALLEMWMSEVSKAPGRVVSSPWPDHIEITNLSKLDLDSYEVTGYVIEVTSMEVLNGGVAEKIPVHVIVHRDQERWYIVEYTEER